MQIETSRLQVLRGNVLLFSDFDSGGDMWESDGDRERVILVDFETPFEAAPMVQASLSMLDMQSGANHRYLLEVKNVTRRGFSLRFRTWADTRIARASASWIAIGAAPHDDQWDV